MSFTTSRKFLPPALDVRPPSSLGLNRPGLAARATFTSRPVTLRRYEPTAFFERPIPWPKARPAVR